MAEITIENKVVSELKDSMGAVVIVLVMAAKEAIKTVVITEA